MDKESEDFEKLMKEVQLEEARAKAEKAREEARHERSKREKTERETELVSHSKWHDGIKTITLLGTLCITAAGLYLKATAGKK